MDAKYFLRSDSLRKKYGMYEYVPVLLNYEPTIGIVLFNPNSYKMVLAYGELLEYNPTDKVLFGYIQSSIEESTTQWLKSTFKSWTASKNTLGRYFHSWSILDGECRQVIDAYAIDMDFFEKLSKFEKENKKRYMRARREERLEDHKLSFFLSEGSTELYDWCYRNLNGNASFHNLWWIIKTRNKYKSKQFMLRRGSITAYNSSEDIDALINELKNIAINAKTAKAISSFNTAQKKILKAMSMSPKWTKRHSMLISKFIKLPKAKRDTIIKKVSCITDEEELIEAISIGVGDIFLWSRKSFMSHIANIDKKLSYNLIYDRNNIVVVEVLDFDTVAYIAKSTSWCITRDIDYWQNYAELPNRKQYVVLNFNLDCTDEYSIVGVTTEKDKTLNASHTMTNTDLNFVPNPFLDIPRKKSASEYLSSIGVMNSMLKTFSMFSPDRLMQMMGISDYLCIRRNHGKVAILTDNCSIQEFVSDFPITVKCPTPYFCVLFFDLCAENDPSKYLRAVLFYSDGVLGINSIGQTFFFDTVLKLFDDYEIDPADYIPMSTTKLTCLLMRLNAMDIRTVVDMLSKESQILKTLEQNRNIRKLFAEQMSQIAMKDLDELNLDDDIRPEEFSFCKLITDLGRNGVMICEIVPEVLDEVFGRFNVILSNQNPTPFSVVRKVKKIIRYVTSFVPEWRNLITKKELEDCVDKTLKTVKLITNEKEMEVNS